MKRKLKQELTPQGSMSSFMVYTWTPKLLHGNGLKADTYIYICIYIFIYIYICYMYIYIPCSYMEPTVSSIGPRQAVGLWKKNFIDHPMYLTRVFWSSYLVVLGVSFVVVPWSGVEGALHGCPAEISLFQDCQSGGPVAKGLLAEMGFATQGLVVL